LNKAARLFLIPSPLAPETANEITLPMVKDICRGLRYFLVENERESRRFLSSLGMEVPIHELHFAPLNKDTEEQELSALMAPMKEGFDMGILSDAGCPGVADPGSMAVAFAHKMGYQVMPLPGPSSILLALMGSGFNGQSFVFHGYLPLDKSDRLKAIRRLESEAKGKRQSQIFMETPYRNNAMLDDLLKTCEPQSKLFIGAGITSKDALIRTQSISQWKKSTPDLHKIPCIFILG
jgi:16S rRNA (cytidine1402-2'-O)-methyltransferase